MRELFKTAEQCIADYEARATNIRQLLSFMREVRLPPTLAEQYTVDYVLDLSKTWFGVSLKALPEVQANAAFDTIKQLVDACRAAGWATVGVPTLAAERDSTSLILSMEVSLRRNYTGVDYQLDLIFRALPHGPYLRPVEEEVVVPAIAEHTEKRLRVELNWPSWAT